MCLAKAYLKENNKNTLLLENVASIEISDQKLTLTTIFWETKEMEASIKKIDFANSNILLEEIDC